MPRWAPCILVIPMLLPLPARARNTIARVAAQQALDAATQASGAIAIVLDEATGQTLATERSTEADSLRSTPGSILKPFFLATALHDKTVRPDMTVFCRRNLHVAGHALECTHPQANVTFAAQEALAYSCNTWFAELARRLTPAEVDTTLRNYGLTASPARDLQPMEARELLALGVAGIAVSPRQMAVAYRQLALEWRGAGPNPSTSLVHQALRDSVTYGMAHNAAVAGLDVAGKTGTATNTNQAWSHGWFCGEASGVILAIYIPHGNGADAATLAHRFFLAYRNAPQ